MTLGARSVDDAVIHPRKRRPRGACDKHINITNSIVWVLVMLETNGLQSTAVNCKERWKFRFSEGWQELFIANISPALY